MRKKGITLKVLLLENIHENASFFLKNEAFEVECINKSLSVDELSEKIKGVSVLGIRSKTNVSHEVLEQADRLEAIGAFCIGTNQIDLEACHHKGVAVFNAPFSSVRSVAELVVGNIIALFRRTFDRSEELHRGLWFKSSKNCFEVRGKKLGIVGYGAIGSQVSVLAESLGMNVYYYDILDRVALGNATQCQSLKELLSTVDAVSLHVNASKQNKNLIDVEAFNWMKNGSYLINVSRGSLVDIQALSDNIQSGKILGAALDVYPNEPRSNNERFDCGLRGYSNVILTPHIGGSTNESQMNIADFVSSKLANYMHSGDTYGSVNFPNIKINKVGSSPRIIHLHNNIPGILAGINSIFAKYNINIESQSLKTSDKIGYVVTDLNKDAEITSELLQELNVDGTIKIKFWDSF